MKVKSSYDYDHAGRTINSWTEINNGTKVLLARNEYNEIGQLKARKLHSENQGSTFLQNLSFTYNERGWLNYMIGGLFSLKLNYNQAVTGTTPQYNGNISSQQWGASFVNTFKYEYDKLNRLTKGESTDISVSESNISYDKAGNIAALSRDNNAIGYTYTGGTNRLNSVSGGGLQNNSYVYDPNGNATTDGSRSNLQFSYNVLNLPQTISGSNSITYTYDASGRCGANKAALRALQNISTAYSTETATAAMG